MTSALVRAGQSAGAMDDLEQVLRWLSAAAGDDVGWRAYMNSPTPAVPRPVLVVVWDATARTCPGCGLSDRRPCPVHLAPDGQTVAMTPARHDCGADLAPAHHRTSWLTDLTSWADVEAVVAAVDRRRPDQGRSPG